MLAARASCVSRAARRAPPGARTAPKRTTAAPGRRVDVLALRERKRVVARADGADAADADDGSTKVDVGAWLDAREGRNAEAVAGVFAIYDVDGVCQYVDYARNVEQAVRAVRGRVGAQRAAWTRVMAFRNAAMATKDILASEAKRWREALGTTPALNAEWDAEDEDDTKSAPESVETTESLKEPVVSPFAANVDADGEAKVTEGDGVGSEDADAPKLELTMENVDKALDEVRPYLIADGGNVELMSIENGIVVVRLNGACGSCASSSATMKGGIEKLLKQKFGDAVEEVCNVSGELEEMSVETIEEYLGKLRNSIKSYGGECKVLTLERGVLLLEFKGPQALAFSIAESIKKKFPLVRECKIKQIA